MRRLALLFAALLPLALPACKSELTCAQGELVCDGACVRPDLDPANCGACGVACGAGAACVASACTACIHDAASCGNACAVLATSPDHCGACGHACAAGQVCSTSGGATACKPACDAGLSECGRACVDLADDPFHCGACGAACDAGQACVAGACQAALQASCAATDQVIPLTAALGPAGLPRAVTPGPTVLASSGGAVYSASGYPAAGVDFLAADLRTAGALHHVALAGSDLEGIAVHDGVLFVSNSGQGTVAVLSLDGQRLDEVPMPDQQAGPNPRGLAFSNGAAYVALGGSNDLSGQAVAVLDLSGLAACRDEVAPPACDGGGLCAADRHCVDGACRLPCATVAKTIDLGAVAGAADAPGAPFPSRALAVGGKVYVTLGNLKFADFGGGFAGWFQPAGSGRLAVIDPLAGDAVSIVDLGPSCGNPGGLAAAGDTLFVACGSLSFATDWPGRLAQVSASTGAVGPALDPSPLVPNGVVICGGEGYVPDMNSGRIRRFDPLTGAFDAPAAACPNGPFGFAWVSDLACTSP